MASTSTNKQPLLVDNVLHNVVDLQNATNDGLDIIGTNTATLLVNGSGSDGAIIEDIYTINRSVTPAQINLYLSRTFDYLRPNEALLVGTFKSGSAIGEVAHYDDMPYVLAPVPNVNTIAPAAAGSGITPTALRFKALYIPRNMSLWAARQAAGNDPTAPLLGVQGGWY